MSPKTKTKWSDDDDDLVLNLVRRHTPIDEIAVLVGRTKAAVFSRLNAAHKTAWLTSGHPSCKPERATTKEQRLTGLETVVASMTQRFDTMESNIADLHERLTAMEDLGAGA